jgi:hypothetical protein
VSVFNNIDGLLLLNLALKQAVIVIQEPEINI